MNKIFLFQVVAINLFGLVVVGGDNVFHVLTVKQIEEQDNCSKQVRDTAIKTFWKTEEKNIQERSQENTALSPITVKLPGEVK